MIGTAHERDLELRSKNNVPRPNDSRLIMGLGSPNRLQTGATWLLIFVELVLFQTSAHATKLVTYYFRGDTRLGAWVEDGIIDLNRAYREMLRERGVARAEDLALALVPPQMLAFLGGEEGSMNAAREAIDWAKARKSRPQSASGKNLDRLKEAGIWFEHSEIRLGPPVPNPPHQSPYQVTLGKQSLEFGHFFILQREFIIQAAAVLRTD